MRYETVNLGDGDKRHAVYDMPTLDPHDYWASVTDVPCPVCKDGIIRWFEAGFVPGSRICDKCGRFFQARGSIKTGINLIRDARFDRSVVEAHIDEGLAGEQYEDTPSNPGADSE